MIPPMVPVSQDHDVERLRAIIDEQARVIADQQTAIAALRSATKELQHILATIRTPGDR